MHLLIDVAKNVFYPINNNFVEIVCKNTSLYVQQCCGKKCFKLRCVLCAVHGTQYTPQLESLFTNIAEHLTAYFY